MMKIHCLHKYILPALCGLLLNAASAEPVRLSTAVDQLKLLYPDNWKTGTVEGRECLILHTAGEQRPPVRRPGAFALWENGSIYTNLTCTVSACSLEPSSKKPRDVCVIFGYQDDTHFYYTHISSNSDGEFHTVIMRVDGDSRTRINHEEMPPAPLKDGWNTIRLEHLESGSIKVWVNEGNEPVMTAIDTNYPSGAVGFGSFDDRAAFQTFHIESYD